VFSLLVDFQSRVFPILYLDMSPNTSYSSYIAFSYIVSFIVSYGCYVIQTFAKVDKLAVRQSMLKVTDSSQPAAHVEYTQMLLCIAMC